MKFSKKMFLYLTSSAYFQSATVVAEGILVSCLHKALPVVRNTIRVR